MMTRLEQQLYEVTLHYIPIIGETLKKISESLERIAKELEVFHGNRSEQPKPRKDYNV